MAETTPLVSSNAFRGTQAHHHFSFQQNHLRLTPPKNPPPRSCVSTSQRFSFHLPQQKHQQPQAHTQHIQIPIRFVVAGFATDPSSAPVLQQNTFPVLTKEGVVLSSRPDEPSSPRPIHVKNFHPPLKRLSTVHRPPRPSVSTPPPVQRFLHFQQPLPEQPPPYEHIFDVRVEEESAEPIECPFVLVGGSPRKEKKRSLRSRLLRHLTGKKAAAQQARGSSTMTSGSHKAKDPSSSPMVEPRNGQLIAHLAMPPATIANNVHVTQSGSSPRLIPRQIPSDVRYLDINGQTAFQVPTVITQNGLIIDRSQIYGAPSLSNLQTTNQVIILHTVPEEDPIQETSGISTVATSSHTTVTITTSEPSTPKVHSVPAFSVHSDPTSIVHSDPTFSVHTDSCSSVHSDPSSSVHGLSTSSVYNNISSPGASHATRLPSPTPSSVFIHDQTPSEQHTPKHRTRKKSSNSSEWSQVKVPQTRFVYSSSSSHKNSQVISGKSDRSRDSSVHSQAEATKDRPVTPLSKPERPHRKEYHQSRKKNVAPETFVEIDDNSHTKSYTINLKPGMYKLNLNFPGKKRGSPSQTININVPNGDGRVSSSPKVMGKQPPVPEPLYYENSKVSLPQRFVHMLKPSSLSSSRTQNSKKSPKVTIIQPSVDNKGPKVITVLSPGEKHQQVIQHEASSGHKRGGGGGGGCTARSQKKERYRWAPFPCVHVSSSGVEETVSEASGCDSWQGYEGVEHLKRQSECVKIVPYGPRVQEALSCELCCEELQTKVFDNEVIDYLNENNVSCDGSSDSCMIRHQFSKNETEDSLIPQVKSVNEMLDDIHVFYPKLQKKWLEDEDFLRKVVEEYFMDPISGSDCDTTCDDSTIDGSDNEFDSCTNKENSMVDGQVVVRKSEESTVKPLEKCDNFYPLENNNDDSFYCDTDETISSLFSDDSLGYDGDVEDVENMKWYANLRETSFDDDCDQTYAKVLNSMKQIESRGTASFNRPRRAPAQRAQYSAEVAWAGSAVKNVGKSCASSYVAAPIPPSVVASGGRSTRLAQPTETCQERGGGVQERRRGISATSFDIDTVTGEKGPSSVGGGGGVGASTALETCHQSHAGCCCDEGVSAVGPVKSNTFLSKNEVYRCRELFANDHNRGLNLGLERVKPLKLQQFNSSVFSRSASLKSSVTDSGDSLCSKCRKESFEAEGIAHEYAAALGDLTNSDIEYSLDCSDSGSEDVITNEALLCGLVFERSNQRSAPQKFDLQSALESLRQLECKENNSSQGALSDSVSEEIESCNRCYVDSEESMADVEANITQLYYNSNFVDPGKSLSDSSNVSNASYVNVDMVDSPGIKSLTEKDLSHSKLQMRRPPKPPKAHRNNDDHRYESFEFSSSYCNQRLRVPLEFNEREPYALDAGRTPGLVTLSGNNTDEEHKIPDVSRLKPGRKRFAKAFQKAVVQIPVSVSQGSPTTPPIETLKSELVIDPIYQRSTTVSLEQSTTPSSGTTCISEYKIGDTPTLPIKFNDLTANNYTHFDTSSSDTDSKRSGKSKKNKKSKPRKYFSGILDAIGNAAPIFRTSLVTSSPSVDERDVINETVKLESPITNHKSDSNIRVRDMCSAPIYRKTSSCNSGVLTQPPNKQAEEIPSRVEVTFSKRVSSPQLFGDPENNLAAGAAAAAVASSAPNASNHWRAAYLGHVGCDSPLMIPNDVSGEREGRNVRGNHDSNSGIKKNSDEKSDPANENTFKYDEMMYENVVFHKNLKKLPRFDVDLNDSDGSDPTNVTTTATITLNCNSNSKRVSDYEDTKVTVGSFKPRSLSPNYAPDVQTCTVSASFSLSNLHYEDWCSAIDDQERINCPDSDNEQSFDKRSESSESIHSEASSFYYTAGANTIYEAVKSVRKSFASEFIDSENDDVNDTNTDFDSSDEVTYNTTANEKIFMSTDDEFIEDRTVEGSSATNSAGSDLMEQLNELHEKYFGKAPDRVEESQTKKEVRQCHNLPRSSKQKRLNSSGEFVEGIVHAVPCVVLTDSDSQTDSGNTTSSRGKSKHSTNSKCATGNSRNSFFSHRFDVENDPIQNTLLEQDVTKFPETSYKISPDHDEESEISEELDKRISGIWTTGTGGDADEESGGENSESTNCGSKSDEFFNLQHNDLRRNNLAPEDVKPPYLYGSSEYWNYGHGQSEFSCDSKYQNTGNYWCNGNCLCVNCHHSYENSPVFTCCENNHQENENNSYPIQKESDHIIKEEGCELPEESTFLDHHGSSHGPHVSSSISFEENKIFDEKSSNNYAIDSDLSISFDSIDNDDGIDRTKLEGSQSQSRDFLDVPENESGENWARPFRDARLEDPNRSSLLDDVITCLAGKWKVSSSSAPPSPGSGTPRLVSEKPNDDGPVRSSSYRSSRSGKPPVSPGSRTRDGGYAARASSTRPQSYRKRSRSASAGAKLRGANNSCVVRPASFVGIPRPTSLSDMVPGTAAYSASQESLYSISLMSSFDDLAPHPQWLAERKKVEGNEAYRNKEYREALQHYTQAIELCPDSAAYYSNRSACFMMLAKYRDALNDAQRAVTLDKNFVKGWLRVGKCHIALGDGGAALSVLRQAQELEPNNTALLQEMSSAQAMQKCIEECAKAVEKKDYRTAVFHIDQALRYALGGLELRINKAEYLTYLGRLSDAEDIVNEILMGDNKNADAIYVRGLCRYYQDNQDAAFQHFQNVLRFVPDHSKAKDTYKRAKLLIQKKEQGNAAFKMGDFARAMEIYSEALEIDDRNKSTNAKLYCNRATVAAKLGKLEQSIADCTLALTLDDGYIKAYLRRANTYQQTEQYEEAVRDLEKVYRLQRSQEHKRMLQEAKAQLKRSKRKDYYKILGVSKTSSDDEIKKAYRKMALLHHPDRHSSASASEKAEHEKKFKELGEAYAVLTDPKKRSMHDRGQDVNDPDCGFSRDANFDPNQVFEAFFGPDFFQSQSSHHHYYDQGQQQQQHQQHQQQFPNQFQGQHPGFQGFPGMPGGFQFEF